MNIHPIPPGLWCVPSALIAITGEPFDAVIQPALNRHAGDGTITGMVVGSTIPAAVATLRELRYRVRQYTKNTKRSRVTTWAKRSRDVYPGRVFLLSVPEHVLVMKDGVVFDSWTPHGQPGEAHPYNTAPVELAYLIDRP